jgi:hypothetical protein
MGDAAPWLHITPDGLAAGKVRRDEAFIPLTLP